ncbi:hypothetical protein OTK49_02965 [Vibrio coralliirubri]|uniref:hypothetical protein n=1 Tax=Vibrio coralliirubri TaxID=1516159 RepID=UPI0022836ED5|nr:hypothetical protein [Vibrio coralliirubri]MCY9861476.1 hypothetical protein [Vibrio coralliirubri]
MNTSNDKNIITKLIKLSDALISVSHKVDEVYTDLTLRGKSIHSDELGKIFKNSKELIALGVSLNDDYGVTSSLVKLETLALSLVSDGDSSQIGAGIKLVGVAISNAALTYGEPIEMRSTLRDRHPDLSVDSMSVRDKVVALLASEIETIGFRSGTYDYKYHLKSSDVAFIVDKAWGA